jgi:cation:H+ antiporter
LDFLILTGGIAGLWIGTELTIWGALAIARRHRLSEFFVGLVILSIGSDLPEIAIAVDTGIKGLLGQDASGVVVGSSIGSVVGQIGFVLGLSGLITHLILPRAFVIRHGAVLLGATVLLFLLAFDLRLSRIDGLILIAMYAAYVFALMSRTTVRQEDPPASVMGETRSWVFLLAGLAAVIVSSEFTVRSVVSIARTFEISEALISVLIIGLGTSLPELSISISAILKGRKHLSVGNIIGSNILDTLLPLGIAATISSVTFEPGLLSFDLPFIFVLTLIVLALFLRESGVRRVQGAIILSFYVFFVAVKLSQF